MIVIRRVREYARGADRVRVVFNGEDEATLLFARGWEEEEEGGGGGAGGGGGRGCSCLTPPPSFTIM